ncbi:MAG: DUF1489 domain-containing protein [Rhodospirillaceae bacterium]|jgi:hypothetical protein|nr:DUF1489 domain-containing protein [Rhodospirillaceae bacterium]MBT4218555.1 DUF1489 domain-containing protein [Rhodospirillaceae bacterium]MBT4464776.1 DUF1489 domain-containing protein [Rhodospirillaceae bacterium]MBT5309052.1 DUF1489 domain-containing protein [Rhodospirillaceae bacterium]MBT7356186.1 DUF1489 domain-containing protein [Rhodospirillaceae bacterium]
MIWHIIKLSVGVEDVEHLARIQESRLKNEGVLAHITRNTPKRADQLLKGGSIYWVIKRFIRVRQRLLGIERGVNSEGKPSCALVLDPQLVRTELKEFRAFQRWRYLDVKDAPRDLEDGSPDQVDACLPPEMAAELKGLGLL